MDRFLGKIVMVLEDDPLLALDATLTLEEAGAIVAGPVATVKTALAMIARHPLDAALLDINLGSENSYPVAEQLIALGIPFIFASSLTREDVPGQFQRYLLHKPADIESIGQALFPD